DAAAAGAFPDAQRRACREQRTRPAIRLRRLGESQMPSINPAFVQLGYVTNDLDRARAFFAATMGVPDFHIWNGAEVHMELYGKPATAMLNLGFAWRAGTMIELIMPVSGSTDVYMPGIEGPAFGLKLHHIGQGVDGSEADFDKLLQAGVKRGW